MTRERDFDRVLEAWFREGSSEMPERLFDAVVDRIERVPQRRVARFKLRFNEMSRSFKLVAAFAALILVAVVGFAVVRGPTQSVGASPSPTPATPSPSAVASPTAVVAATPTVMCLDPQFCAGLLAAGSHSSNQFQHQVSLTVPAGWVNALDTPTLYSLQRLTDNVSETQFRSLNIGPSVYLLPDPQAADTDAACNVTTKSGIGPSSAALAAWIGSRPGIVASKPTAVTVGGVTGQMVDLSVASTDAKLCRTMDSNGVYQDPPLQYLPLVRGSDGWEFGPVRPQQQRYIFVDVGGGHTVAIVLVANPADFDKLVQDAMPIIQSMTFKP